jgi:hypothetical protein
VADSPTGSGGDDTLSIWVVSEVNPDGGYTVGVHVAGRSWTLDRDQATRYALTVVDVCERADYDAAVLTQMSQIDGMTLQAAGALIAGLRESRPPADDAATAPLRFDPIVSGRTGQAAVHVHLDGQQLDQWTPDVARSHAMHVLQMASVADLDAQYWRHMADTVGLDDEAAGKAVALLGQARAQADAAAACEPASPGAVELTSTGTMQRVDPGEPLTDRIPPYDPRAGTHYWIMMVAYRLIDPGRMFRQGDSVWFDRENLVLVSYPGCYYCEQVYSPRLEQRRCPGDPR